MYSWVDHTGEIELEIDAADERAVFADALEALHELTESGAEGPEAGSTDPAVGPPGVTVSHDLELSAPDRATLLAEFLMELLFYSETEGFVPARLVRFELHDTSLRATVEGRRGNPPHLVKAVTYHRLSFDRSDDGWRAHVVFDV